MGQGSANFGDEHEDDLQPGDVLASQRAANAQSAADAAPAEVPEDLGMAGESESESPSFPTPPTPSAPAPSALDAVRAGGPQEGDTAEDFWAARAEGQERGILPTQSPRSPQEAAQQQASEAQAQGQYQRELDERQRQAEMAQRREQAGQAQQARAQAHQAAAAARQAQEAQGKAYAGEISDFHAAGGLTEHDAAGNVVPQTQPNPKAGQPGEPARVPLYRPGISPHDEPSQQGGQWLVPQRDSFGRVTLVPVDQSPHFHEDPATGAQTYRVNGEDVALGVNGNIVQRNALKAKQSDLLRAEQQDALDLADARLRLKDAKDDLAPLAKPAKDAQTALDAFQRQLGNAKTDSARHVLQAQIADKQKVLADPNYVAAQQAFDSVNDEVRAREDAIAAKRSQALEINRSLDKLKAARLLPDNVDHRLMLRDPAGPWPADALKTVDGKTSLDPGFAEVLAAGKRVAPEEPEDKGTGGQGDKAKEPAPAPSHVTAYRQTLEALAGMGVDLVGDKPIADEIRRAKDAEDNAANPFTLGSTVGIDAPITPGSAATPGAQDTALGRTMSGAARDQSIREHLDNLDAQTRAITTNADKAPNGRLTAPERAQLADLTAERTAVQALRDGQPEVYDAWSKAHPTDLASQAAAMEAARDDRASRHFHYAGIGQDVESRLDDEQTQANRVLDDPQAGLLRKAGAVARGVLGSVADAASGVLGKTSADLAAEAKASQAYHAIGNLHGADAVKALALGAHYLAQDQAGKPIAAPDWTPAFTLGDAQRYLDALRRDAPAALSTTKVFLRAGLGPLPGSTGGTIAIDDTDPDQVAQRHALSTLIDREVAKSYGTASTLGAVAGGFAGWELGAMASRAAVGKLAALGALGQTLKTADDAVGTERQLAALSRAANYVAQGTQFDLRDHPQSMGIAGRLLSVAGNVGTLAVSQELGGAASARLAALSQSQAALPLTVRWLAHSAASGAGLLGGNGLQQVLEGQNPADDQGLGANIGVALAMGALGVRSELKMRRVWRARDAQLDALGAYLRSAGVPESPLEQGLVAQAAQSPEFSPEADRAKTALFGHLVAQWGKVEADPNTFVQRHEAVNALRGQLETARANGDGAQVAALKDQLGAAQAQLATSAAMLLRQRPGVSDQMARLIAPDADGGGLQKALADNEALRLAAVEIGRQLRPSYLAGAKSDAALGLFGGDPVAQAGLDQMIGAHAVLRDLVPLVQGGKITADKAAAFEQLGLLRLETQPDGSTIYRVSDDALPLMPKALRDQLSSGDAANLSVSAGNPGAIANNLVRSGEDRLRAIADGQRAIDAQRKQAAAEPEPAASETNPTESATNPAEGGTEFTVPITVELPGIGTRTSRVKVSAANAAEAAKIAVQQARGSAPKGAVVKVAGEVEGGGKPAAKPAKATKAEKAKAEADRAGGVFGKVYAKWKAHLAALGITQLREVGDDQDDTVHSAVADRDKPQTKAPMGPLAVQGDTLYFHRGELARLIRNAKGVSPAEAVEGHLVHELIHAAGLSTGADGLPVVAHAEAEEIARTAPEALSKLAARAYANWDKLSDYQRGHELLRMVVEGRYRGTITEAIYRALGKVLAKLGLDLRRLPENALLTKAADRVKAVLDAHEIDIARSRLTDSDEGGEVSGDERTTDPRAPAGQPGDGEGTPPGGAPVASGQDQPGRAPGAALGRGSRPGPAQPPGDPRPQPPPARDPGSDTPGSGAGAAPPPGGDAPAQLPPAQSPGPAGDLTPEEAAEQERQRQDHQRDLHDQAMREAGYDSLFDAVRQRGGLPGAAHPLAAQYGEELRRVLDALRGHNARRQGNEPRLLNRHLFRDDARSPDDLATALGFADPNALLSALEHELNTGQTHWVHPDAAGQRSADGTAGETLGAAPAEPLVDDSEVGRYLSHYGVSDTAAVRQALAPLLAPVREDAPTYAQLGLGLPGEGGDLLSNAGGTDVPAGRGPAAAGPADELAADWVAQRRGENASLAAPASAAAREALRTRGRLSSLIPELITESPKVWDIRGAVIAGPSDVFKLLQAVRSPYVESLKAAVLDEHDQVVHSEIVSIGSLNQSIADPREMLRALSRLAETGPARRIVFAHNHPSGDPSPSGADHAITQRIGRIAERLGFTVVDHVITNGDSFYSFRERGQMSTEAGPAAPGTSLPEPEELARIRHSPASVRAPWETLPRRALPQVKDPRAMIDLVRGLSSPGDGAGHLVYLSTRQGLLGIERVMNMDGVAPAELLRRASTGVIREGAYGVAVHFPGEFADASPGRRQMAALRDGLKDLNAPLLDAIFQRGDPHHGDGGYESAAEHGILGPAEEPLHAGQATVDERQGDLPGLDRVPVEGDLFHESDAPTPAARNGRPTTAPSDASARTTTPGAPAPSVAELVRDNMGLAVTIANGYRNIPGTDFDDILGEARKALVLAARGFDPAYRNEAGQSPPFGSYAGTAIRNALNTVFGRESRRAAREGVSADEEQGADARDGAEAPQTSLKDTLPDPRAEAAVRGGVEHEETRAALAEALAPLPERVKTVLRLAGEGKGLREIGEAIGLSHEMARQILANGRKAVEARLRERGFQGVDEDGVLYAARAEPGDEEHPPELTPERLLGRVRDGQDPAGETAPDQGGTRRPLGDAAEAAVRGGDAQSRRETPAGPTGHPDDDEPGHAQAQRQALARWALQNGHAVRALPLEWNASRNEPPEPLHSAPATAGAPPEDIARREIAEESDRIQHAGEDRAPKPSEPLGDILTRGFAGKLDALDRFVPGAKALLTEAHVKNARIASALRIFRTRMIDNVRQSFGYPSWWRLPANRDRLARFTAELLPTAARLNATAQDAGGRFTFGDFWMRAGEIAGKVEKAMGMNGIPITLAPGVILRGRHGEQLRVKERVDTTEQGRKRVFWQLERFVPAADQERIHAAFHEQYPEAAHWLDSWINPNLRDSRVDIGGIAVPDFNRFSLRAFWGEISPFGPMAEVQGYTPDVYMTRSLAGMLGQRVRDLLDRTWTGPGREYKSGEARERGQVRDLFAGFNARAAEAHLETQRKELAEGLLAKALKVLPDSGVLPPGYVLWSKATVDNLLRMHPQAAGLTQAELDLHRADLTRKLGFGQAGHQDLMIHQSALEELRRPLASAAINNGLLRVLSKGLRGATAGYLANPFTVANYQLSEEIFTTMHTLRKGLEGLYSLPFDKRQARLSLYEAANLAKGVITDRWYNPRVRELVPDELFHGPHRFSTISSQDYDKSPAELLRDFNVTGAILKALRFANVDIRAKQRLAFASLLAHGRLAWDDAQAAGAIPAGTARGGWLRDWVQTKAPPEVWRQAYDTAVLVGHDYANVPPILDESHQWMLGGHDVTPFVNALRPGIAPFAKYPYNLARQGKRFTYDSVRDLTWGAKDKTPQQRRAAAANLTMMAAMFLLARHLMEDDQDGAPQLGRSLDDLGKRLDGAYNTAGRLNITHTPLGRTLTAALDVFGLKDEAEADQWLRIRALPYASSAAALSILTHPSAQTAEKAENVKAVFADMVNEGILVKMVNALRDENGPFDQGKNLSYVLAENAFDGVTGRVVPPPLLHTAAALADPLSHRTRPTPSLGYDPGWLEALRNKIPGAARSLPTSGAVRIGRDGSSKAEQAVAETLARELPEANFRRYADPRTGAPRLAYVVPGKVQVRPRVLELIRALGLNVKFMDHAEYERELAGIPEEK